MLIQRLGGDSQTDERFVGELLSMIRDNPGSCDEVWFASIYGYPKIDVHRARAEKILPQAERFRRAGVRVSLQISNTVGHGEYISKYDCSGLVYPGSPVRNLVGFDGTVSKHCFCWRDRVFRNYILDSVRAYFPIQPDAIWFDDDFRPNHHSPVEYGCFCDGCVAEFNRENGCSFTREELVRELNEGDLSVRRAFIDFTKAGIADFMSECCEAIHLALPKTHVGLQQGTMGGFIGDSGNRYLYETIYRATGLSPYTRPGGGTYTDHDLRGFVTKANEVERQIRECPDCVTEIRPEIESLPYVAYGKSATATCLETTLYLAVGANGASYAMMMDQNEDLSFYRREFELFSLHREYWEKLAETNRKSVQSGVNAVYPDGRWALRSSVPFAYAESDQAQESILRYISLPISYKRRSDGVQILHADDADRISDETLSELLAKPMITDGETVEKLLRRGVPFDVSVKRIDTLRLYEECADHPINRGVRMKEWGGRFAGTREGYRIDGKNGEIETVGVYRSVVPGNENDGATATAIIRTPAGAQWAVFGFDLWNRIVSTSRRDQICNTAEYLGKTPLSARLVDGFSSLLLPRAYPDGKLASVTVVNCTPGETGEYRIRLQAPEGTSAHYMAQYGKKAEITVGRDGIAVMPSLAAWNAATLFFDETGEKTK